VQTSVTIEQLALSGSSAWACHVTDLVLMGAIVLLAARAGQQVQHGCFWLPVTVCQHQQAQAPSQACALFQAQLQVQTHAQVQARSQTQTQVQALTQMHIPTVMGCSAR
jgi:hypothetical protein